MTDTADAFLTGHGVAVPLGEIETALTQLWGPAAEREGGPPLDHPTVTRVALANLVVGALDDPTDRVGSLLQAVLSSYPSRAIVARGDGCEPSTIAAEVSARCHLPTPGQPQVCSEQITLRATPDSLSLLPGAARTLLEAGMPTVLWWAGDPSTHADVFAEFAADATRILLDLPDPGPMPAGLPALDAPMVDLAWYGITGWRERIAELFDPPDARAGLGRIAEVGVVAAIRAAGPAPRIAAWLVAWLAGQLGWEGGEVETDGERVRATYRAAGRPVNITISSIVDATMADAQVISVDLDTDDGGTFRLFRPADRPEEIRVEVCAASYCDLPRIVWTPTAGTAERLSLALEASRVDRTYGRALPEMLRLTGARAS